MVATVALSQVVIMVDDARVGAARERFAAASAPAVRACVALYVLSLVAFLASFATVGFGT